MKLLWLGIIGMLTGLILASCGGSASSTDSATIEADEERASALAADLTDRIGVDFSDDAAVDAWSDGAESEWRQLTAACMLAEGFEYSQQDWTSPGALPTDISRTSREYAQTYGFGVVPAFLAATYDPDADYDSANSLYVASLAPAERDAYFTALHGNPEGENDSAGGFPRSGCAGEATEVAFALMSKLEQLQPDVEAYDVRREADPRMIAIRDEWANCMAEAGFAGVELDRLRESFINRLVGIFRSGDVFAYSPGDIPDLPQADLPMNGPSWRVLPELNDAGRVRVDALLQEEIATATSSFDCREATREAEEQILREYEIDFLNEFEDKINAVFPS